MSQQVNYSRPSIQDEDPYNLSQSDAKLNITGLVSNWNEFSGTKDGEVDDIYSSLKESKKSTPHLPPPGETDALLNLTATKEDQEWDKTAKSVKSSTSDTKSIRFTRTDITFTKTATGEHEIGGEGPKTGFFLTVFNLLNDLCSVGCMAFPLYLQQSGLYSGLIFWIPFFVGMCIFTFWVVYAAAMKHPEAKDYPALNRIAWGRFGKLCDALVALAIFGLNFGAYVGFLIIIPQIVPDLLAIVFGPHNWFNNRYILVGFSVLLFSPLAFFKSLANYGWISLIASFTIYMAIFCVYSEPFIYHPPPAHNYFFGTEILTAVGGFAYYFNTHDLSLEVVHTMKNPTPKRYMSMGILTYVLGTVAIVLIGILGNLMFGGNVQSNILLNFPMDNSAPGIMANLARAFQCACIIVSQPYSLFMPRVSIIALIELGFEIFKKEHIIEKYKNVVHYGVTVFLLLLAMGIAMATSNLGLVFSTAGGLGGTSLCLIFPSIMGWVIVYPNSKLKWLCLFIIVVGILCIGVTILAIFFQNGLISSIEYTVQHHSS